MTNSYSSHTIVSYRYDLNYHDSRTEVATAKTQPLQYATQKKTPTKSSRYVHGRTINEKTASQAFHMARDTTVIPR